MVNIEIVDPRTIDWDVHNVLYRGNTQEKFEEMIITSFVKGKPIYYGFTDRNGRKRTYVTKSLDKAIIYTKQRIKDIGRTISFLTKHPIVINIKADQYLDKLRKSDEGEGIFIEGEIDVDDIFILFSSECNKFSKKIGKNSTTRILYRDLIGAIGSHRFNKEESLIKRYYRKERRTVSDLELFCFSYRLRPSTPEEQQKIAEAITYLKRKLEGK